MDAALTDSSRIPSRRALLVVACAPLVPQIFGSAFNIWYNEVVVDPLLTTPELQQRFVQTIIAYNALVFPLAVAMWLGVVFSLRKHCRQLIAGTPCGGVDLDCARRRLVHLPWLGALISGIAWLLCIPVFLISLSAVAHGLSAALLWHLPISFAVSAFIAVTQSFFLIELASHQWLFPVFFRDVRPDRLAGIHPLSLRGRGLMWAISAGVCPIGSLILMAFAPPSPGSDPVWFELVVGTVGISFGLWSAWLISRLVAEPVDQLRAAAHAVAQGDFSVRVPLRRADEFGALIGEFNQMTAELGEKERLRKTFGLHVGRKAAEQILALDPGLSGLEQVITVMFVDIRGFTARASGSDPQRVLRVLNEFLGTMVEVVESQHSGMINKFLGDGFMALFGAGAASVAHADEALAASREMIVRLSLLNTRLGADGEAPLAIGIGLHTGPAIVGSIGSPERLEFTAIGSTVNLASRIESLTKTVGATLLLSEATRLGLRESVQLRALPPQMVKGVDEPVSVWTLAETIES
jgi:adenylate cyclase